MKILLVDDNPIFWKVGTASKDFGMKLSADEDVDAGSSFTVEHTFTTELL